MDKIKLRVYEITLVTEIVVVRDDITISAEDHVYVRVLAGIRL